MDLLDKASTRTALPSPPAGLSVHLTPPITTTILVAGRTFRVTFQATPDLSRIEVLLLQPDDFPFDRALIQDAIRGQYVHNPL